MIEQASIQSVIDRADIVEIIGQFVRLRKRGTNYVANCPFHNEKTPSFSVNGAKGIFKCFGCGKGGNVVSFIQEYEKLTWPEAIRWLADFYKIPLEETAPSAEVVQSRQVEESLRILNEFAANWFHQTLLTDEEGKSIGLSYFKQRGLRQETIEKFKLGYCPENGQSFVQHATAQGYSLELLEKSGLVKVRDGRGYDNYRGRIIFPIQNQTGRILGFGARILKSNDKAPKYINTPENELYIKSRILYGLYQGRQSISKNEECLLVEGYLDVISLHQAGVENAVASSGTSLTEEQLRLIGQLTRKLTILYDGDAAGIKAALRGTDMALEQSFQVGLALLPEGEDPDSFVQKNGRAGFADYLAAHRQDVIGFRLELGLKEAGTDPVKKNKLVNEIAESIARINKAEDFSLQQHYLKKASTALEVDEAGMVHLVNKYIRDRIEAERRQKQRAQPGDEPEAGLQMPVVSSDPELPAAAPALEQTKVQEKQEWALMGILIEHGAKKWEAALTVADYIFQVVDPELIENRLARQVFDEYAALPAGTDGMSYFTNHPNGLIRGIVAGLLQHQTDLSPKWKENYGIETFHDDELIRYRVEVESVIGYFELKKNKLMQMELMQKMKIEKDEARLLAMARFFQQLKATEQEILKRTGTVIVKM